MFGEIQSTKAFQMQLCNLKGGAGGGGGGGGGVCVCGRGGTFNT